MPAAMEIFKYMHNRTVSLEVIFDQDTVINRQDMDSSFKQLGHSMEKQLRVWWDIATLDKHTKENITPRRLRWDIAPNDNINDPLHMDDWFRFFNKCEKDLLGMIIKRRQFKLKKVEGIIIQLKEQLAPFADTKEYKDNEKALQEAIQKYDKMIQGKKQKKYKRDVMD